MGALANVSIGSMVVMLVLDLLITTESCLVPVFILLLEIGVLIICSSLLDVLLYCLVNCWMLLGEMAESTIRMAG